MRRPDEIEEMGAVRKVEKRVCTASKKRRTSWTWEALPRPWVPTPRVDGQVQTVTELQSNLLRIAELACRIENEEIERLTLASLGIQTNGWW
jgi:hypothetical protein